MESCGKTIDLGIDTGWGSKTGDLKIHNMEGKLWLMQAHYNVNVTFNTPKRLVIMNCWTEQQRAFTAKSFYQNSGSYAIARRIFRARFGILGYRPISSAYSINLRVDNYFEQSSTTNKKRGRSERTIRTLENIERVKEAIGIRPRSVGWPNACFKMAVILRISFIKINTFLMLFYIDTV